jgi:hypothetical protein
MWPTPVSNAIKVHAKLPVGNDLPIPFEPYVAK